MEFSDSTVIARTAKRLSKPTTEVQRTIDAYAEEWLRHAREVETAIAAKAAKAATTDVPDGTPPPPSEAPRVTAEDAPEGELVEAMRADAEDPTGHPS